MMFLFKLKVPLYFTPLTVIYIGIPRVKTYLLSCKYRFCFKCSLYLPLEFLLFLLHYFIMAMVIFLFWKSRRNSLLWRSMTWRFFPPVWCYPWQRQNKTGTAVYIHHKRRPQNILLYYNIAASLLLINSFNNGVSFQLDGRFNDQTLASNQRTTCWFKSLLAS